MELDDSPSDRQSQARSAPRRGEAVEAPEDVLLLLGRDAGTVVAHREKDLIDHDAAMDLDARAGRGVSVSVGQEVHEHLLQLPRVTLGWQRFRKIDFQILSLLADNGTHRRHRRHDDGTQVERLGLEA